jgi:hypothetical protein
MLIFVMPKLPLKSISMDFGLFLCIHGVFSQISSKAWGMAGSLNWQALGKIVLALRFFQDYNLRRFVVVFDGLSMLHKLRFFKIF